MLPHSAGTESGIGPMRHQPHRQRIVNPQGQPYYNPGSYAQPNVVPSTPLSSQQVQQSEQFYGDSPSTFHTPPYNRLDASGDSVFSSSGSNPAGLAGQVTTDFGLVETERMSLHELANVPPLMRELRLHASLMTFRREQQVLKDRLAGQEEALQSMDALMRAQWQPSAPQKEILRDLLRHFAVKNIKSYTKLAEDTFKYVSKKADNLRLPGLRTDMVMQGVLNGFLRNEAIEQKSALRKLIFAKCGANEGGAVVSGPTLNGMVTAILDDWHFGPYTTPVEPRVLARFAFLRRVATPIARKRQAKNNNSRGDTGFWLAVEKELSKVRDECKGDKEAEKQWENKQIDADKQLHPGDGDDDFDFDFGDDGNDDGNDDENDDGNDPDATRVQSRMDAQDRDADTPDRPLAVDDDMDELAPAAM